jgi:hypothetical protein
MSPKPTEPEPTAEAPAEVAGATPAPGATIEYNPGSNGPAYITPLEETPLQGNPSGSGSTQVRSGAPAVAPKRKGY